MQLQLTVVILSKVDVVHPIKYQISKTDVVQIYLSVYSGEFGVFSLNHQTLLVKAIHFSTTP